MSETKGFPWGATAWFGLLLLLCYAPVLQGLVKDWAIDEDMGHGFFVPLVAGYIVWQRRQEILSKQYQPNYFGLLLIALGAVQLMVGTLGVELFLMRTSFLVSLLGVVFTLGGWQLTKALLFPLCLLLFMIPLPSVIYYQITFPLQLLASKVAEHSLDWLGIPVLRDGNILELPSQRLSVVEACSGIRSLLSLSFLSLVYGYFFDGRTWMRWLLFLATIPIAITSNSMRVTLTGLFSERSPDLAQGIFHSFEGWSVFMVALVMLVAVHKAASFVSGRISRGRE
jgi:exosortase